MLSSTQIIVSRFNENIAWTAQFAPDVLLINKGEPIELSDGNQVIQRPNFGGNQYDMCRFIFEHYDDLPAYMLFLQGNPFDHCELHQVKYALARRSFTPLETSLRDGFFGKWHRQSQEGLNGFCEINNSWYIRHHGLELMRLRQKITCPIENLDEFLSNILEGYSPSKYRRFTPGSQFGVESTRIKRFSKDFWGALGDFIPKIPGINGGIEAHIVERSLWLILSGIFEESTGALEFLRELKNRKPIHIKALSRFEKFKQQTSKLSKRCINVFHDVV